MELNYKLIVKQELPTEARVTFAVQNTDFYCWLYKEQLLINAEAPHLDLVLDALQIYFRDDVIDWDGDSEIDAASKRIMGWWTSTGSHQVFEAFYKWRKQQRAKQHEAWARKVMDQYSGDKGIEILDAMGDEDESYLYDTLYHVVNASKGVDDGWNDFIRCAYLYAYNKGIEAAQKVAH